MITFRNLTLCRGQNELLSQVNWTIYHKQRIGVIGENGAGKTSLFALLQGQLSAEKGDLDLPTHLKMASVAQETPGFAIPAIDYVLNGDSELSHFQNQLLEAEAKQDGNKIALIHEKLSIIDAYSAPSRAAQMIVGLGFQHDDLQKFVSDFSGGWRVRLNLARALMSRSDMLLLDEPTNHLNLDAIVWLEEWLKKYAGTLLLISHDRDFLDRTVDHIAFIKNKNLKIYSGNYSTFEKTYADELLLQQAAYEKQQKQIAHMQSFVNRFRAKASKARQAQSRMKAIERMDLVCAVQAESPFQFHFREPKSNPYPLISVDDARVAYADNVILDHLHLTLAPKERIAILGPNGAGKSTFIKLLAGEIDPVYGTRQMSTGLKIGYFAQHQVDHLNLTETPISHLKNIANGAAELELRKYLGSFGFVGDRVYEPIQHFSGGEKSRLALALIIWQSPNLLLLDEPTNHLDLEMRQALSLALQEYEGAMVLVSHDRYLVRTTTDQLYLVADKKLVNFDGDLDNYQQWLMDYRKEKIKSEMVIEKQIMSKKELRQQEAKLRDERKPLLQRIKKIETQLEKLQSQLKENEISLTDPALYEIENKQQLQQLLLKQTEFKKQIEKLEADWLNACEQRDKLDL
ncbi:MAG: hypothetical protein ACD_46C00462G0002 [uncultured bacterium]|nr:MAG: hypothetical protein ACD_46C00462G0002 [uncultured bacterium]